MERKRETEEKVLDPLDSHEGSQWDRKHPYYRLYNISVLEKKKYWTLLILTKGPNGTVNTHTIVSFKIFLMLSYFLGLIFPSIKKMHINYEFLSVDYLSLLRNLFCCVEISA